MVLCDGPQIDWITSDIFTNGNCLSLSSGVCVRYRIREGACRGNSLVFLLSLSLTLSSSAYFNKRPIPRGRLSVFTLWFIFSLLSNLYTSRERERVRDALLYKFPVACKFRDTFCLSLRTDVSSYLFIFLSRYTFARRVCSAPQRELFHFKREYIERENTILPSLSLLYKKDIAENSTMAIYSVAHLVLKFSIKISAKAYIKYMPQFMRAPGNRIAVS